ncbi:unnamed protein product, partial [Ectocarpus sp. 12 AP-2014]
VGAACWTSKLRFELGRCHLGWWCLGCKPRPLLGCWAVTPRTCILGLCRAVGREPFFASVCLQWRDRHRRRPRRTDTCSSLASPKVPCMFLFLVIPPTPT